MLSLYMEVNPINNNLKDITILAICFILTISFGTGCFNRAQKANQSADYNNHKKAEIPQQEKQETLNKGAHTGQIAFIRDSDIWIMDSDGQNQLQVTNTIAKESDLSWSPNGKYIAFTREEPRQSIFRPTSNIWIVKTDMFSQEQITFFQERKEKKELAYSPVWSQDGQSIAFSYSWLSVEPQRLIEDSISILNLDDKKVLEKPYKRPAFIGELLLSDWSQYKKIYFTELIGDGNRVLILDLNSKSSEKDVQILKTTLQTRDEWQPFIAVCSPDGEYLAYNLRSFRSDGPIVLRSTQSGQETEILQPQSLDDFEHFSGIVDLAWSADGNEVIFEARYLYKEDKGYKSSIWAISRDGKNLRKIADNASAPDVCKEIRIGK